MSLVVLISALVACGGGEPPKPAEPPKAAEPPPAPAPAPAPPPAPAVPPSGPYMADPLASAAYEKARAAGADAAKPAKAADEAAIAEGKKQFEKCVTCHGATGNGDGAAAAALPQKPAAFTWNERWDATSIGVKHWIIQNGVEGTAMAKLGLSDEEAWDVLAYIDGTLRKR